MFKGDNSTFNDHQSSSGRLYNANSTRQHLADSVFPTLCFILYENALSINSSDRIYFREYLGTRSPKHHSHKLYLPQVVHDCQRSSNEQYNEFSNCIKDVLKSIPAHELSSYVISIRTGVVYFFSKRFRFNHQYTNQEINDVIQKKISLSNDRYYYYYSTMNKLKQSDDSLRTSFCNIKPISQIREFVKKLKEYHFYFLQQKHIFRIYLQSDDNQIHVCTVDPALNYSIVEFSKDFHRTSNIGKLKTI